MTHNKKIEKYEYKLIQRSENTKFTEEINALGKEGWHIVNIEYADSAYTGPTVLLERVFTDEEEKGRPMFPMNDEQMNLIDPVASYKQKLRERIESIAGTEFVDKRLLFRLLDETL